MILPLSGLCRNDDSDDDSEDDELQDDEDDLKDDEPPEQPVRVAQRGGGKTLMRMRPPSDSESDGNEEAPPQRIVPRTGGKSLIRPPEDDVEESESEAEDEPPEKVVPVRPRTGGKMLSMMQPPADSDDDDDDDEEDVSSDDEEEEKIVPVRPAAGGGKQLRPPGGGKQFRPPSGGKQLRPPPSGGKQLPPPPAATEPKPATVSIMPNAGGGGKQLRRAGPGGGGKQLRRPVEDSDSEDEDAEPKTTTAAATSTKAKPVQQEDNLSDDGREKPVQVARSSGGGKQLVRPAGPGKTGKQLRRAPAKPQEDEESSDDEEDFGDDSDDSSEEESDYEEAPKKGKGKKKPAPKKAPAKKPAAKSPGRPRRAAASRKQIVVEEEEEIFGDDDISSEDDSSDEEMELDENNTEALIKDEEDRKYLDSLPELEREAILGERFEKLKEQYDMKKAMREAKKAKAATSGKAEPKKKRTDKKKKSTGPSTDGDEELARKLAGAGVREKREAEPSGAKSKKAAALAALKKNRKIQKQAAGESSDDDSEDDFADDSDEEDDDEFEAPWQKAARDTKKKSSSRLDDGLDDEDEEMEDVDASKKAKDLARGASQPTEAEAGLEDFRKVTIPRDKLRDWCNEPYFKAAVLECYVRVTIGEDDRGVRMHRLCEIVDVTPVDVAYKFPLSKKGEKPVTTNLKLKLRFGTSERDFAMYLVSNAPPSLEDLQKYTTAQRNNRLEIVSKRRATKLYRLQQNLVENYTYTTEDIEKNLQKRKKLGKLSGNLGGEKTKAAIALQAAKDAYKEADNRFTEAKLKLMEAGDDDNIEELNKTVKECEAAVEEAKKVLGEKQNEERRLREIEDDYKRRLKSRSRDRNWAKVNARALKENQRADREAHKEKAEKADVTNLSARRKVKPKVLWKVGQGDEEEKEEDATASEKPVDKPQAKNDTEQPTMEAPPTLVQEATVAGDSAHQLAIDEEALAKDSLASLVVGGHRAKKRRIRKGISLEEYFERKEKGNL